jgi:hypothetical protein
VFDTVGGEFLRRGRGCWRGGGRLVSVATFTT